MHPERSVFTIKRFKRGRGGGARAYRRRRHVHQSGTVRADHLEGRREPPLECHSDRRADRLRVSGGATPTTTSRGGEKGPQGSGTKT
eukprot:4323110-Prymnesium_polylepis.1